MFLTNIKPSNCIAKSASGALARERGTGPCPLLRELVAGDNEQDGDPSVPLGCHVQVLPVKDNKD